MHSDQQSALAILQQAAARPSARFRVIKMKSQENRIKEACAILSKGDPQVLLPLLASMVWSIDVEIRKEVSAAFLELALSHPLSAWPRLDEDLRQYGVLPQTVAPNNDAAEIITAACHPSGFIREKAIRLFPRIPPLLASCLLLIRINDWVASIRSLAKRSLPESLALLDSGEKMRIVPLVQRLHECGRQGDSEEISQWMAILTEPFNEQSWLHSWQRCAAKDRRTYISLLQNRHDIPGPAVRNALLRSHDRFALIWFVQRVLPHLEIDESRAATLIIAKARAVPVRREWISALAISSPVEAHQRLIDCLTDKSRSLRSFARFHLTELAPMDFTAHYRRLLMDLHHEIGALAGLAEVAPDQANSEALARLQSGIPPVRKAAILALNKNCLHEHLEWLIQEAGSPLPGIAKAARKRLVQIAALVGPHLLSHFASFFSLVLPLQIFFVHAAPSFGKWIALELLLRCSASPVLADATEKSLKVWASGFNRSFVRIPCGKRTELIELVQAAALEKSFREYLLFVLNEAE